MAKIASYATEGAEILTTIHNLNKEINEIRGITNDNNKKKIENSDEIDDESDDDIEYIDVIEENDDYYDDNGLIEEEQEVEDVIDENNEENKLKFEKIQQIKQQIKDLYNNFANLLDNNFNTRVSLYGKNVIGETNLNMSSLLRTYGFACKFTGSGGAFICIHKDTAGKW